MNLIDKELARQDAVRITQAAKKLDRNPRGLRLGVPDEYIVYSSSGHPGIRSSYLELSDRQRFHMRLRLSAERMNTHIRAVGASARAIQDAFSYMGRAG